MTLWASLSTNYQPILVASSWDFWLAHSSTPWSAKRSDTDLSCGVSVWRRCRLQWFYSSLWLEISILLIRMPVGSIFVSSVIFSELLQLVLDVDICPVFRQLQITDAKGMHINYLFATYAHLFPGLVCPSFSRRGFAIDIYTIAGITTSGSSGVWSSLFGAFPTESLFVTVVVYTP